MMPKDMMRAGLFVMSLLIATISNAQIGIPSLDQGDVSFKDLLKQAEEKNTIALIVSYTDAIPSTSAPRITGIDSIISNNDIVTDVVDPYVKVNYPLFRRTRPFRNAMWITVHPDNTIIGFNSQIITNDDLSAFVRASKAKAQTLNAANAILQDDKNNEEAQKMRIRAISTMYESKKAQKYINKYIGNIGRPSKEELEFVFDIAEKCACGNKLEKFINQNSTSYERLIPHERLIRLKQKFINTDLKEKGLLEPFYVWKSYEREFGVHADSLYRLFAIDYFAGQLGRQEELVNECIDYLASYPDTPWRIQDPMYMTILGSISKKEDLELMLDLVSAAIFKEKNYRNLDVRATLLYRLGKKERALKMMEEISTLARQEGVRYKSMITTLKK